MRRNNIIFFAFITFCFFLGTFNLFAETTMEDVRNAVISALSKGTEAKSAIGPGSRGTVWFKACERTVKVPAGKSKESGFRDAFIMTPDDDGWVVEIYGPYKESEVQKIWSPQGHGFYTEQIRIVDGKEKRYIEAERTLPGDSEDEFFGLILTCGYSCSKKVIEDFLTFSFPAF